MTNVFSQAVVKCLLFSKAGTRILWWWWGKYEWSQTQNSINHKITRYNEGSHGEESMNEVKTKIALTTRLPDTMKVPLNWISTIDTLACSYPLKHNGVPFAPTSYFPVHSCRAIGNPVALTFLQISVLSSDTAAPGVAGVQSQIICARNTSRHD